MSTLPRLIIDISLGISYSNYDHFRFSNNYGPQAQDAGGPLFYKDQRAQAAGRRFEAQESRSPENRAAGRRSSNLAPWIWAARPPSNKKASLSEGL